MPHATVVQDGRAVQLPGVPMKVYRHLGTLAANTLLFMCVAAQAQNYPPPNTPPPAGISPAGAPMSQDLLDSLLAPIALYPDQLLAQVLMAATYPLDVVEAARFVKANPNLRGAALDQALMDKTWDASVLSLASFPQVLDMMSEKLDWTQRLGDAFLADEAAVMQTVQGLRMRAQQAGNLQSTPQQQVLVQDRTIVIQPAQPEYLYVPVYNPTVIYGPWWGPPIYRPWFWYPPAIWGYPPRPYNWAIAGGFFWGTAWGISRNNWGWSQPNWHSNHINININNNNVWVNRPQYRDRNQNGNWNHNPDGRRGVAYRDNATANRYHPANGSGPQSRENYRGRDNVNRSSQSTMDRPVTGGGNNFTRPTSPGAFDRPASGSGNNLTRPTSPNMPTARPASTSRPQPGFQPESRPQIQRDANRGAQSRASMPQQRTSSPSAPRSPNANRGGGGGGGDGGGGGGQGRSR
jgi:Protein of unknown function (DUF3300)